MAHIQSEEKPRFDFESRPGHPVIGAFSLHHWTVWRRNRLLSEVAIERSKAVQR